MSNTVAKYHYLVTSKTKSISKLICAWSNLQFNKRLSVIIACKYAMKLFGNKDIVSGVADLNDDDINLIFKEFVADTCTVAFNVDDAAKSLDLLFYKSDKSGMYDWLSEQLSVTQSISFAIYLFVKKYGLDDAFDIFMDKINDTMEKEISDGER